MSYAPTDDYAPPRLTPAVLWLIAINVAVFFVQVTVQADLPRQLGFGSGDLGAFRWWTVVTYMFAHEGFWHLALNMYMLWAFGPRLERAWSTGAFTRYYLWCGLGGVLLHAMLVRGPSLLVGASGAIFGVVVAYARRWPNDEVYLFGVVPMRMKWLAIFMVVVNLTLGAIAATGDAQGGGMAYFAHLGGALAGWLWLLRPAAPSVERLRQRVAAVPDVGDEPPRPVPRSLPRPRERGSASDEIVEQSKALTAAPPTPRPRVPPPRPAPAAAAAAGGPGALDLVLDKISAQGLASLTADERRLLEDMSRQLRDG